MKNIDVKLIPSFNYFEVEETLGAEELIKLQTDIEYQMHYGSKHFLFDLSKLNNLNSAAIRIFVRTQQQLKLVDGFISLLYPTKSITDMLQMSELSDLLNVKNDLHDAMKDLKLA